MIKNFYRYLISKYESPKIKGFLFNLIDLLLYFSFWIGDLRIYIFLKREFVNLDLLKGRAKLTRGTTLVDTSLQVKQFTPNTNKLLADGRFLCQHYFLANFHFLYFLLLFKKEKIL